MSISMPLAAWSFSILNAESIASLPERKYAPEEYSLGLNIEKTGNHDDTLPKSPVKGAGIIRVDIPCRGEVAAVGSLDDIEIAGGVPFPSSLHESFQVLFPPGGNSVREKGCAIRSVGDIFDFDKPFIFPTTDLQVQA